MADGMLDVELVEFVCPYRNEVNLYVTNIAKSLNKEEVEIKLRDIFSKHGLVFEVQVFDASSSDNIMEGREQHSGISGYYAFVKFYSANAAATAKKQISGKWLLGSQFLKVQFANRKKFLTTSYPLHMSKCAQLANHYFGFNGWCTSVTKMKKCPQCKDITDSQPTSDFMFTCTVRLEIKGCDCYCEGTGFGGDRTIVEKEGDSVRKMQLVGYAKKLAHRHAFENAFKRVLIIVTANGKVGVEINQTDIYDCDFNGLDQKEGTVQVNYMEETDTIINNSDDDDYELDSSDLRKDCLENLAEENWR